MHYTTTFLLFGSFILSTQATEKEFIEIRRQLVEKCKNELNSPLDAVEIVGTQRIPKTEAQRCLMECLYKYANIVKDGKFNREGAVEVAKLRFPNDTATLAKVEKILNECRTGFVADPNEKCSLGKKLRECFFGNPASKSIISVPRLENATRRNN